MWSELKKKEVCELYLSGNNGREIAEICNMPASTVCWILRKEGISNNPTPRTVKRIDLTGQRFGRLVVIKEVSAHIFPSKAKERRWLCRCDCGNEKEVLQTSLRKGHTQSCGCLQREFYNAQLMGQRFGRLIVIKEAGRKKGRVLWKCKCDCGKETMVVTESLRGGHTKSCGCLNDDTRHALPEGESLRRRILSQYKRQAKNRNLEWDLSEEEFNKLTQGNCFYCGIKPKQQHRTKTNYGVYIYNGIDRKDNTKGYFLGNCVSCCGRCNRAKDTMPFKEFVDWVGVVFSNLQNYKLNNIINLEDRQINLARRHSS